MNKKKLILVDMDGVLADFEKAFLDRWKFLYPNKTHIPLEKRNIFYLKDQYPKEEIKNIYSIILEMGFYLNMEPIKGSIEAMHKMLELGHNVLICTSPIRNSNYCVQEKYEWVRRNLGKQWELRLNLVRDKKYMKGDYLIDDKPDIRGEVEPDWEHIVYDQPYNRNITDGRRRMTWENWQDIIN